jgi:anti-sigma factor RsiW
MNPIAERCAPFDDDLSALLDGQLDATRAADVRAHAESCRDCAQRLAALRGVDTALRRMAAAPLDASRRERMRSALATSLRDEADGATQGAPPRHPAPPRRRRWLAPAGFAAAAAAVATLVVVTRMQPPAAPPAERVVVAAAERVAPKLRADAEAAAREFTAHGDAPLGASAPPSAEALDPAAALATLSPGAREKLRERLATMQPAERSQLLERLARLPELSQQERSEVAATLARLGVVTPEERARILSDRETQE